jgi:hypothetical protein
MKAHFTINQVLLAAMDTPHFITPYRWRVCSCPSFIMVLAEIAHDFLK